MEAPSALQHFRNDSLFLPALSLEYSARRTSIQFRIREECGDGSIAVYPMFPGLFITINDFKLEKPLVNKPDGSPVSCGFLKIEYCLNGACKIRVAGNTSASVRQEECLCCIGWNRFREVQYRGDRYSCVSLFCYVDEFKECLQTVFDASGNNCVTVHNDSKSLRLLHEIVDYMQMEMTVMSRLRVMELLFHEIHVCLREELQEEDRNPGGAEMSIRQEEAQMLLLKTDRPISRIMEAVGHAEFGGFAKAFRSRYDISPLEYRAWRHRRDGTFRG
jgi:AraC-like DNA-binding protein